MERCAAMLPTIADLQVVALAANLAHVLIIQAADIAHLRPLQRVHRGGAIVHAALAGRLLGEEHQAAPTAAAVIALL